MSLNHFQYSYSQEISQNDHSPQMDNLFRMNSQNNQLISFDLENTLKNGMSTSVEYCISNLSSPIKNSFQSTQESDYIDEKCTLNFISEFVDDEVQNAEKSQNQKQFSIMLLSECIFFNELEKKIFKWLDDEGVKHVSPQDKIDKYFYEKKTMVSSQILSIQNSNKNENTCNKPESKTTTSIRKVSLLERRKQQNKNLNAPSSCINLGQSTEIKQIGFQTQYSL